MKCTWACCMAVFFCTCYESFLCLSANSRLVWFSVVSLHVIANDCLCGQYSNRKKGLVMQQRSWLNITLFLIAFSAAATDHNSPIPQGLHHRPTREHYNPLRGEGEASPQVGICEVWFCIHDAVTKKDIPTVDLTTTCQNSVKSLVWQEVSWISLYDE